MFLRANAGEPLSGAVIIEPDPKYPFRVLETKPKIGTEIQAKIFEKQIGSVKSYILTVENLKKDPGRYYDVVVLRIDSPIKPEIQISVYGQILDPPKKMQ